jgi:transcriptional regulator with XRE-family HTH domain
VTKGDGTSDLAAFVRHARADAGMTQSELARRAGVTPSYVSRIESAAWERGGPLPSDDVLRSLARALGCSSTRLIELRQRARGSRPTATAPWLSARTAGSGQYGVSLGQEDVQRAAERLLARNPARGSIRVWSHLFEQGWSAPFTAALARRLAEDTAAVLYRVCVVGRGNLEQARATTEQLADGRPHSRVHNIRTRFCFAPPAMLDVVVGEVEALIGVPDRRGHPFLRASLVVDDPDLVGALKDWYDDFIWQPAFGYVDVPYGSLNETVARVRARLDRASAEGRPPTLNR